MKQNAKSEKNSKTMRRKSQKLFEKCYFDNRKAVFLYIYRKVNKKELTEDITADVFVKLAEHPEILEDRDENGVRAWLFTVARNKVIDHFRKLGRNMQQVEMEEEIFEIVTQDEPGYLEQLSKNEEVQLMLAAVEDLSPEEKEIITLRFNDDMQFAEIADVLGKSEGAVKMTLYRAFEKLKKKMEYGDDGEGDLMLGN